MSLALSHSDESSTFRPRRHFRLVTQDEFTLQEVLGVGDHPGYTVEEAEGSLFLIFGGAHKFTPGRNVDLYHSDAAWTDTKAIGEFGGRHYCRLSPGNLPSLLAQFWPAGRQAFAAEEPLYLACLVHCHFYEMDFVVTARMARKGYCLKPFPYGETGKFDGNVEFAVPTV